MYPVESKHRGGTVGVPCGTHPRYLEFENALEALQVPSGTTSLRLPGSNVTRNCEMISDLMAGEWLWLLGDDHTFPADTLLKLLDHNVDVVVPICSRRGPPFLPVLYKDLDIPRGVCTVYTWQELGWLTGLVTVAGAGSGGMLIRHHVLDALTKPRFENATTPDGAVAGEDITLCDKITREGYTIWADLDQTIGHLTSVDIRPVRGPAGWTINGIFDRRILPLFDPSATPPHPA